MKTKYKEVSFVDSTVLCFESSLTCLLLNLRCMGQSDMNWFEDHLLCSKHTSILLSVMQKRSSQSSVWEKNGVTNSFPNRGRLQLLFRCVLPFSHVSTCTVIYINTFPKVWKTSPVTELYVTQSPNQASREISPRICFAVSAMRHVWSMPGRANRWRITPVSGVTKATAPSWVHSGWCLKSIASFCNAHVDHDGCQRRWTY